MKTEEEIRKMLERIRSIRKHPFWWGGNDNTTIHALEKILSWVIGEETEDNVPFMDTIKEMESGNYHPEES
jgi:hypothetical protein